MKNIFNLFYFLILSCNSVYANVFYEGSYTFSKCKQINWALIQQLLPDSRVIVDVGTHEGLSTFKAASLWPEATIFALEANPRAYVEMLKHIAEVNAKNIKTHYIAIGDHNGTAPFYLARGSNGKDISYEQGSSLLPRSPDLQQTHPEPEIEVPCMILDDWCQLNNIEHIDILKLELEGFELQALQCSPNILKKVKMIYIQSFFYSDRIGMTNYFWLKDFLYKSNFIVLVHWYTPGGRGNVIYVTQDLYDLLHKSR